LRIGARGYSTHPTGQRACHRPANFVVAGQGKAVKAAGLAGGGIAVDEGGLQGEAHGAHLHLHLGGAGLRALQFDDRAVHIDVAAEQVDGF
jgi:hypothetical protein